MCISAKSKPIRLPKKERSVICHSTECVSTAPESSGCVLYTTPACAWPCTECEACCSCLAMKLPLTVFVLILMPMVDWSSTAMELAECWPLLCTILLTCDPALWLIYICRDEISQTDLLQSWNSLTILQSHLNLLRSSEGPIFSQMSVNADWSNWYDFKHLNSIIKRFVPILLSRGTGFWAFCTAYFGSQMLFCETHLRIFTFVGIIPRPWSRTHQRSLNKKKNKVSLEP